MSISFYSSRKYSRNFLFYSSGVHRDLHSFPTRRSSDLEARIDYRRDITWLSWTVPGRPAPCRPCMFAIGRMHDRRRDVMRLAGLAGGALGGGTLLRPRDRKSTRLNSSHMSISYAVFCLK